ncbi:MAG: hypothetical protein JSW33_12695 [bacterium]|nr:MAG: hypothetical protein JSW33_12695 [bacterium]
MKTFLSIILMLVFLGQSGFAQTRTDETKKTVKKVVGDTTITEAVTISQTEDITPRRHMFVINPLKFFLFYNITYFQQLTETVALGGGIQTPTIKGLDGFGFNVELRLYPAGKTLRGFYVAPNISYNKLSTEDEETDPFSMGVLVGWQWFPGDQFAIGLGIGIDYYKGSIREEDGDLEKYSGKVPALRFDIGYAW